VWQLRVTQRYGEKPWRNKHSTHNWTARGQMALEAVSTAMRYCLRPVELHSCVMSTMIVHCTCSIALNVRLSLHKRNETEDSRVERYGLCHKLVNCIKPPMMMMMMMMISMTMTNTEQSSRTWYSEYPSFGTLYFVLWVPVAKWCGRTCKTAMTSSTIILPLNYLATAAEKRC
jgi:hypothetical protein